VIIHKKAPTERLENEETEIWRHRTAGALFGCVHQAALFRVDIVEREHLFLFELFLIFHAELFFLRRLCFDFGSFDSFDLSAIILVVLTFIINYSK